MFYMEIYLNKWNSINHGSMEIYISVAKVLRGKIIKHQGGAEVRVDPATSLILPPSFTNIPHAWINHIISARLFEIHALHQSTEEGVNPLSMQPIHYDQASGWMENKLKR